MDPYMKGHTLKGFLEDFMTDEEFEDYWGNKDTGETRLYDPKLDVFKTVIKLNDDEKYNMNNYNKFHIIKGYETNDEELKRFNNDFIKSCQELKEKKIWSIEYDKYYNHSSAVEFVFKMFSKNLDEQQPINEIEYLWFEKCHNGAIIYCDEPGTYNCYGYDFSSFYPRTLSSEKFIIPIDVGEEKIINELSEDINKIEFGIYRVKISSDEENFKKVFSISKTDYYTSTSLKFAMVFKKRFNVNIELIKDDKPNCLIYKEYTKGHHVFRKWFEKLFAIRKQYPKNILIKHLLSSLWGTLAKPNRILKTIEEIQEEKLKVRMGHTNDYMIIGCKHYDSRKYYELINSKNPYKINIRLKPFLSSQCRNITAGVVLKHIDDVIRVQNDNVTFKTEQKNLNIEY
eukprot:gene11124-14930_t